MPDVCSSLLFVENREQNRIEPSRKWSDLRAVCVATGTRRMGRKGASLVELTEKKKPTENSRLWGIGGGYEDRTHDLLIANQTLSHLS